jgi:hypothetical protein
LRASGAGATARVGVGPGGTDYGIVRSWGRWAVVRCRLLVGPYVMFELEFDCLN